MPSFFRRQNLPALAYKYTPPVDNSLPTVVFCGGYRSDMEGTKAIYLEEQCKARGQGYLRFDYRGHGASEGLFEEGLIGQWSQDATDIINHCIDGDFVIVGSSMGGWIGLKQALAFDGSNRLKGFIGIAAAPDFTKDMFENRFTDQQRKELLEDGVTYLPNDYSDEPYIVKREFHEDGNANLILTKDQRLSCPVYLLQGTDDKDVPWQTAEKIKHVFGLSDENVIYIEGGDHRLSAPDQLAVLWQSVQKCD